MQSGSLLFFLRSIHSNALSAVKSRWFILQIVVTSRFDENWTIVPLESIAFLQISFLPFPHRYFFQYFSFFSKALTLFRSLIYENVVVPNNRGFTFDPPCHSTFHGTFSPSSTTFSLHPPFLPFLLLFTLVAPYPIALSIIDIMTCLFILTLSPFFILSFSGSQMRLRHLLLLFIAISSSLAEMKRLCVCGFVHFILMIHSIHFSTRRIPCECPPEQTNKLNNLRNRVFSELSHQSNW